MIVNVMLKMIQEIKKTNEYRITKRGKELFKYISFLYENKGKY